MLAGWEDSTPAPPPGGVTQSMWGFNDGRFDYELVRVFGPVDGNDPRGPICHVDEPRSYWQVTWMDIDAQGGEHTSSRSLSFANARALHRLSFDRFSSIIEMRKLMRGQNWRRGTALGATNR
jgi:hypothetical protein